MKKSIKFIYAALPLFLTLTTILVTLAIPAFAAEDNKYDHTYVGIEKNGYDYKDTETALFQLKDNDQNISLTYCADKDTYIVKNSKYTRTNISDANYYTKENGDKIRAIIRNTYPFISLAESRSRTGLSNLSEKEAITASQLAVWHYANGENFHSIDRPNVKTLYNWLISLPGAPQSETPIAQIAINQSVIQNGDKYQAKFSFKADSINDDGTPIVLSYCFDKDLSSLGAACIDEGIGANGYHQLSVTNLPEGAEFNIEVSGVQTVKFDGYFYDPQGGRNASQSLVGAHIGKTNVCASAQCICTPSRSGGITVNKINSITLDPLPDAVFELSKSSDFSTIDYVFTSDQTGAATVTGLSAGTWYLREKTAPKGYVAYEETVPVSVGSGITTLDFKNTPLGKIEITKVDQSDIPIQGVVFSLYQGTTPSPETLLFDNLVTNENGYLLIDSLNPGDYTLVETFAPPMYRINSTPIPVEVVAGSNVTLRVVNEKATPGSLNLLKRDATSKIQLSGAVIGIYTDEKFENQIAEITTLEDQPVTVEDLLPGTYYVKENQPPTGYLLDSKPQTIKLEEGQTVELTFFNSRSYPTAGNYGILLTVGLSLLACAGAGYFVYRKHLSQSE